MMSGQEIIVTKNGREVGRFIPKEAAVSYLTDSLIGILKEDYKEVVTYVIQHHERLNGSGYPRGLKGDEIGKESRLLIIIDVFEALTSRDRPYKKPMPAEKAIGILYNMAEKGEIDMEILNLFEQSKAWIEDRE